MKTKILFACLGHDGIRPFILVREDGKKGAGLFHSVPFKLTDKARGGEPEGSKTSYPWLWFEESPGLGPSGGRTFMVNRWNDVHLTLACKKEARL